MLLRCEDEVQRIIGTGKDPADHVMSMMSERISDTLRTKFLSLNHPEALFPLATLQAAKISALFNVTQIIESTTLVISMRLQAVKAHSFQDQLANS